MTVSTRNLLILIGAMAFAIAPLVNVVIQNIRHSWGSSVVTATSPTGRDDLLDRYISASGRVFSFTGASVAGKVDEKSMAEIIANSKLLHISGFPNDPFSSEVNVNCDVKKWIDINDNNKAIAVWVKVAESQHKEIYVYRTFGGSCYCTGSRDYFAEDNCSFCTWGRLLALASRKLSIPKEE